MGRWQAQVTSEQKVKLVHPKAEVRWNENSRIWGVFFDGPPRFIGIRFGWSEPDAYGKTPSNAWVNAAKKLAAANGCQN